jgi:hypothetical protein
MIDAVSPSPTDPACQLAPSVYLAVCDDTSRVVDLDRGRFLGLDAIATRLLAVTLEHGPDQAATTVAREYDAPEAQVRADLDGLLAHLNGHGALRGFGPAPAWRWRNILKMPLAWLARPGRWEPGLPTLRATGRLLRRAWFSLRMFGWCGSIERWRSYAPAAQRAPLEPDQRRELIDGIHAVVCAAAASTIVFAAACKERALAAYYLLRVVHGLPAELVIGVEHYPFGAHAWVEIDGRVVSDDQEHCARFVPVARHA